MSMISKVYIAAPFFSEVQIERVENIKKILDGFDINYFSPKDDNYCPPVSTYEEKYNAFKTNISQIYSCDLMIAVTDGLDCGTMQETGVAYSNNIPIIYYADSLGNKPFNLMLAMSGIAVARSTDDLRDIILSYLNDQDYSAYRYDGVIE